MYARFKVKCSSSFSWEFWKQYGGILCLNIAAQIEDEISLYSLAQFVLRKYFYLCETVKTELIKESSVHPTRNSLMWKWPCPRLIMNFCSNGTLRLKKNEKLGYSKSADYGPFPYFGYLFTVLSEFFSFCMLYMFFIDF